MYLTTKSIFFMFSISQLISQSSNRLKPTSDSARLDIELLLGFVLKKDRSFLHAWPEKILTPNQFDLFTTLLNQRLNGTPVAHLLGFREFWSLNLEVSKDTLIPRPETERLVELALEIIPLDENWSILDLGTGSGAIALAIAKERPACVLTATDQSDAALVLARQNAEKNNITNINFFQSDWFSALNNQKFEMIVANPPYIRENDEHLNQGDVRFEPRTALVSGQDGLKDIRQIVKNSTSHLKPNGFLIIEHGYDQAQAVCELLHAEDFQNVDDFKDYNQQSRVAIAQIK